MGRRWRKREAGRSFCSIISCMDIERTMQFIVEQQAQLTASVQRHDEQLARNDAQIAQNSEHIARNSEHIGQNSGHIATLTNLVGRLAQSEIQLVDRIKSLEDSQQEMSAAMARLFDRLDRFIQGMEGNGHKSR